MDASENCSVTPVIIPRECGGYLAISPKGFRLRVGVEGATEEEARNTFETRITSGLRILAEATNRENVDALAEPVSKLHNAEATYASTEHVHETHGGEIVWEGDVHVYTLEGHLEADTCYAWVEPNEETGRDRIFAVLKLGPVQSPADAVRASILDDFKSSEV